MLKKLRNNLRAVVLAVLVHVALIAMLVVSLDWTPKPQPVSTQPAVVQATVVDNAKLTAAQRKKQEEAERKKRAEQEAEEKQRAEEQRREEEKRQAAEEVQRKAEDEAKHQEQIKQERLVAEQKRAAEAKREALKEKQAAAEKRHTEQLRRAEEKRLAAADAQRKIETEKKRRSAQEAQERREAEQQIKEQLASEEQAAHEQQAQTLISQYIPLIKKRVEEKWLRPPSAKPGMSCTVTVRLLPGGEVTDARVTVSSGDAIFDRSVEAAVSRASPLPLPSDPALFEYFRELNFIFKP
ncbi:MAG: cell envelope integrity protein TolA [Gammaproteobacteria bacterium]|nr:cell envelope integrity protein TolA [Gammaproteobacteria bacterium]